MRPPNTAKLDAALTLAASGLPVFPLQPNSKNEHAKGTEFDRSHATTNPDTIRTWWGRMPRANVAYIVPAGEIVVDVDTRTKRTQTHDTPPTWAERTASGGGHYRYKLPDDLPFSGQLVHDGYEVFGAGGKLVGAGSTINGRAYIACNAPIAKAPAWVIEAIQAHHTRQAQQVAATRAKVATIATETEEQHNDKGRIRWAQAALLAECDTIAQAVTGGRFNALRRGAFKVGQIAHILGENLCYSQLESATNHYLNPLRVAKILAQAFKAGQSDPREPARTNRERKTLARQAVKSMLRLIDLAEWGGFWECKKTRVRAGTAHAALQAILHRAGKANSLDLHISSRELGEMMSGGKMTANKTIKILMAEKMLTFRQRPSRTEANEYTLEPAGFLALQRGETCEQTNTLTCQLNRSSDAPTVAGSSATEAQPAQTESETSSSVGLLRVSLCSHVAALAHRGLFSYKALGRSAFLVVKALVDGAVTVGEIAATKGLHRRTVELALQKMAVYGLVVGDGASYRQKWAIAPNFAVIGERLVIELGAGGRAVARVRLHERERKAWRDLPITSKKRALEHLDLGVVIQGFSESDSTQAILTTTQDVDAALMQEMAAWATQQDFEFVLGVDAGQIERSAATSAFCFQMSQLTEIQT
jgi:hypothetical protein